MVIEPAIAALGDHYDPDEAAEIERVLWAYNGTIPDGQLISEEGRSSRGASSDGVVIISTANAHLLPGMVLISSNSVGEMNRSVGAT